VVDEPIFGHCGNWTSSRASATVPADTGCSPVHNWTKLLSAQCALFGAIVVNNVKTIILPRQARDKHADKLKNKDDLMCAGRPGPPPNPSLWDYVCDECIGAKTPFWGAIFALTRSFYQDRLRTDIGETKKRRRFVQGGLRIRSYGPPRRGIMC
jgi:hypothetical protein